MIVCEDVVQGRRTVFLGVFGEGVTRNSLDPDKRLALLADHLSPPAGGVIVDNNALFLPVLALTPLLGNSVRPGLWEDYVHGDHVMPELINGQLVLLQGYALPNPAYAQALHIVMHTHIVGRASGDSGTGGDARRKTLLQAYEALKARQAVDLPVASKKKDSGGDAVYPVAAIRTALNYQPDAVRLNQLQTLLDAVL